MKIVIKGGGHNLKLLLPTGLIFSKGTVWLANHVGRRYAPEAMANIPPEALAALFAELRRIKKRHGSWELVEVESVGGEKVNIIL